jgi:hypothetical protein
MDKYAAVAPPSGPIIGFLVARMRIPMMPRFPAVLPSVLSPLALPALPCLPGRLPDKPIKIVVTFPPGGSSDIRRIMSDRAKAGQSVVVNNRPAPAPLVAPWPWRPPTATPSCCPTRRSPWGRLRWKIPYDPVESFPMWPTWAQLRWSSWPTLPAVSARWPIWRPAAPAGWISAGRPGSGHIHGELMKKTMGVNLVHVPYRGGAPMTTDLISGVIPVGIDVITSYLRSSRPDS